MDRRKGIKHTPDLLEACKNLVRSARTYGTHNMGLAIDQADQAIAEAEKEEHDRVQDSKAG